MKLKVPTLVKLKYNLGKLSTTLVKLRYDLSEVEVQP